MLTVNDMVVFPTCYNIIEIQCDGPAAVYELMKDTHSVFI